MKKNTYFFYKVCVAFFAGFSSFLQAQTLPLPDHIVIVIEENHAYSQIIGSVSAPYINQLADSGALFTKSYGLTHPSQPNYLMFYSGSDQGINGINLTLSGDNYPSSSPWNLTLPFHTKNLGACLIAQGKTFIGYAEGLPSVGFLGATSGNYASKHAVYSYWQGTGVNNIPPTDNQPLTSFPTNFTNLPTVSYVIPNLNDDMHNGTDPTTIVTGDTWLKTNLDAYVQWAKTHNSLLIVTFDEDDDFHSNQIATIFTGPMVKKGQYSETINHYNILRTVEDIYGICHDANDSTVAAITDCWLSPATAVNELHASDSKFQIFPNPTNNGQFSINNLQFTTGKNYELAIYNMVGEIVFQTAVNSKQEIINLNQPNGIYFLKIKNDEGVVTKKLIIQK